MSVRGFDDIKMHGIGIALVRYPRRFGYILVPVGHVSSVVLFIRSVGVLFPHEEVPMELEGRIAKRYLSAEDVPETVKDKAEKLKEQQNYGESKAFAIAWSIYCCKNPDSEHCKQNEYFTNRPEVCEGIRED